MSLLAHIKYTRQHFPFYEPTEVKPPSVEKPGGVKRLFHAGFVDKVMKRGPRHDSDGRLSVDSGRPD